MDIKFDQIFYLLTIISILGVICKFIKNEYIAQITRDNGEEVVCVIIYILWFTLGTLIYCILVYLSKIIDIGMNIPEIVFCLVMSGILFFLYKWTKKKVENVKTQIKSEMAKLSSKIKNSTKIFDREYERRNEDEIAKICQRSGIVYGYLFMCINSYEFYEIKYFQLMLSTLLLGSVFFSIYLIGKYLELNKFILMLPIKVIIKGNNESFLEKDVILLNQTDKYLTVLQENGSIVNINCDIVIEFRKNTQKSIFESKTDKDNAKA